MTRHTFVSHAETEAYFGPISSIVRRLLNVRQVSIVPVSDGMLRLPPEIDARLEAACGLVYQSAQAIAINDIDFEAGAFLGAPVLMGDGRIAGVLCAIDLQPRAWTSDDKQALADVAALAATAFAKIEAEARSTLLQQTIDGLFAFVGLMTPDGILIEANPSALQVAAMVPDKIFGKPLEGTYMWQHDPAEQRKLREAIREAASGRTVRYDVCVRLGTNQYITVDFGLAPVFDADGRVTHIVPSAVDISPRLRAEDQIRFQARILNAVEEAIIATDLDGKIIFWNAFATQLYGWQADEVLGRNIIDVTPSEISHEQAVDIFANLQRGRSWVGEFVVRRRDGTPFWSYVTDSPIVDASGKLVGIIGVSHDISRRKHASDQLAHLQRITSALSKIVSQQEIMRTVLDESGRTISATAGHISLLESDGQTLEVKAWMGYPDHIPSRYRRYPLSAQVASAATVRSGTAQWFRSHEEMAAAYPPARELEGQVQIEACAVLPLVSDQRVFGVMTLHFGDVRDFADSDKDFLVAVANQCAQALLRAESYAAEQRTRQELQELNTVLEQRVVMRTEQLQTSRDRLRELAARLQNAREEERTRIAREVHDVIGQSMTAIKMSTAMLGRKLQQESSPSLERVHEIIAMLDDAIRSVRRVATELRPSILDDMGLVAAVDWYVRDFGTRYGLKAEFECAANDIPMSTAKATALYRLVQEALTNVARHAQATQVRVELREDDDCLFVQVQDNGRGIPSGVLSAPKSLGLIGMLERVHEFSGSIDFDGAPGQGTIVTVRVPADGDMGSGDEAMRR